MEVIRADSAGFCFGVKRAVDLVYEEIGRGERIYTYGPIIHNDEVVRELAEKGVSILNSPEELDAAEEGTVIIRSHGVEKEIHERIRRKGLRLVDATCPFVLKIHKIVAEEAARGNAVIIAGNPEHPEVQGILSYAGDKVSVIATAEEAEKYVPYKNTEICMVSQTTFNLNKFKELVEIFDKKGYSIHVVNTICSATSARQKEALSIAERVDAMIVVGGAQSSNSRKLYEICRERCSNTIFIQTLDDLVSRKDFLSGSTACVGITAGASTPNKIIEEVQNYVRGYDF